MYVDAEAGACAVIPHSHVIHISTGASSRSHAESRDGFTGAFVERHLGLCLDFTVFKPMNRLCIVATRLLPWLAMQPSR